jgi:hypothetical protein
MDEDRHVGGIFQSNPEVAMMLELVALDLARYVDGKIVVMIMIKLVVVGHVVVLFKVTRK